ncbi:uncharacterized protein [Oscarella lobularis]|uniref:uncharacterized protein n=1 Tax=Oscarella lobularis TaxID=121494 RepID=UPI003313716C
MDVDDFERRSFDVKINAITPLVSFSAPVVQIDVVTADDANVHLDACWFSFYTSTRNIAEVLPRSRITNHGVVVSEACVAAAGCGYFFCTVQDDRRLVHAVSPLFYVGAEKDCFWPCDERANIYYDGLLMYCRPENVLYWSNCQTYRTEDYDKYMKKREADEYSITMKEVVGDRIHFWNHCPNLPVFCNAFRHLEENSEELPSVHEIPGLVGSLEELMQISSTCDARIAAFARLIQLISQFLMGDDISPLSPFPLPLSFPVSCEPDLAFVTHRSSVEKVAYGFLVMKSDASERKSGRRELAQYVRIAPMDFERSLGLAFGHEDHINYCWPTLAVLVYPASLADGLSSGVEVFAAVDGLLSSRRPVLKVKYSGPEMLSSLYQLFVKTTKTLVALREYATKMGITPQDFVFRQRDKGQRIVRHVTKINRRVYLGISRSLLWTETAKGEEDEERVVIKYLFGERHGDVVHRYASDEGFAPRLLGRRIISPCGFSLVMAYAEGDHFLKAAQKKADKEVGNSVPLCDRDLYVDWKAKTICRQLLPTLEKHVRELHLEGFVHGDLRSENIIVDVEAVPPRVSLIDFDFSGVDGVAEYEDANPLVCYPSPNGVTGVKVQQLHDWYFVAGLKSQVVNWEHRLLWCQCCVSKWELRVL